MVFPIVTGKRGFTLIELLVVMTIIALLLSIAAPRYFGSEERAREAVLHENLSTLREALDKYYADTGKYPDVLGDLVEHHYLRRIPVDPFTGDDSSWITQAPDASEKGRIYDVKSGAKGKARDGTSFSDW